VKNQLKSLSASLFGKAALGGADAVRDGFIEGSESTGPIYLYTSIEGQIRALADLCFTLHDYEAAASNYRLVLYDYKKDKALRHVAAASEMLAACHLLLGTEPKKQDEYLDAAYSNFLKVNQVLVLILTSLILILTFSRSTSCATPFGPRSCTPTSCARVDARPRPQKSCCV
jgi:hypothetical protein